MANTAHRPDLIVCDGPVAVEVELSRKESHRLDSILHAWQIGVAAGRFTGVRYLCGEQVTAAIQPAVARTFSEAAISVEPLVEGVQSAGDLG
jgi:hypothetical protein